MLHTVNKSPFERNTLESCFSVAKEGSAILLIEDGVYGALEGTAVSGKVKEAMGKFKLYALGPDLEARGVKDKLIDGIEVVDYAGFVNLAATNDCVNSWL